MLRIINQVIDPAKISHVVSTKKNPVILDSQSDDRSLSRYSIISFDPIKTIKVVDNKTYENGLEIDTCPFSYIEQLLTCDPNPYNDLVFNGGFIGTISYQALDLIYDVKLKNKAILPKINGAIYEQAIIVDYVLKTTTIFNLNGDIEHLEAMVKTAILNENNLEHNQVVALKPISMQIKKEQYLENVEKVKAYIKSGDVYEINYTTSYATKTKKTDYQLFNQLKINNPAPFAAYLKFSNYSLISASPELFFMLKDNKIFTQPMKGTMSRSADKKQDLLNLEILKNSEKDQSELAMIIDLMRNDLSKICQFDSVKVENLYMIKPYSTVYQQVSDVKGKLKPNVGFKMIFESLFPSGSITGAPKLRSIEVIDELETQTRDNYTGAIGFYSYNNTAVFNVAIRTITKIDDKAYVNVGGAIVWDSIATSEYQECQIKAKALLNVLGYYDE